MERLPAAGWPPGARGVGARAVAARPRRGGWLGPGRYCAVRLPPRRGWPLGPAGRPPPKRRLAAVPSLPASEEVGVAGPPVTAGPGRPEERCQPVCAGGRPPSEEGGYASGGRSLSLCYLSAEPKPVGLVAFPRLGGKAPSVCVGPSAKPRLRVRSAAAGSYAWDLPAPASWLGLARRPLLPGSRRTLAPGCGPAPAEAEVVMASSLSRPGKPGFVQASLLRALANQRLPWGRLPRPFPPQPKRWVGGRGGEIADPQKSLFTSKNAP